MSVELDPPELGFRRPFNHEVMQILRLRNLNDQPVAFKVKTTAPKQYCVRPNSGRIDAGNEVQVQVLLQAMKEDPPMDVRCRDKFLVQSVVIDANEDPDNIASIWSNSEKINKDAIRERKIRVNFLPSHDSTSPTSAQARGVNGEHASDDAPPAYTSPSPKFGSPAPMDTRGLEDEKSSPREASSPQSGAAPSALSTAGVSAAASSVGQTVQQQLDQAKDTIAGLRAQLTEQGVLRQRKTDAVAQDSRERATAGTSGVPTQHATTEGVPVQIVAALCLLSFLLAYFFF